MLVIILGGDLIVIYRRFLRQREVTLVYLNGVSSDALGRAMTGVRLIVLWPSWLLVGWPVWVKTTARSLIWS